MSQAHRVSGLARLRAQTVSRFSWRGLLALLVLGAVLPGSVLVGCSDATSFKERQILVEVDPSRTVGPPMFDDAGNIVTPEPTIYGRILVLAGDDVVDVPVNGTVELAALLLDSNGDPVPGERIGFKFIDEGDLGDAELSARRVITDDNGYARVEFIAGEQFRSYTVEVSNPETRTLEFGVNVVDLPSGGLQLAFDYQGPVELRGIEIYIIDDVEFCEDPYYLTPPEDVVHAGSVNRATDTYTVEPILAGTRLSVVVRGRVDGSGVLAAGGCTGDIVVRADETRRVQVPIFLLPLQPAGSYDVINHFDFSDAIPGSLGDVISALLQFFGDQNHEREIASLIFDLVEGLVREAAGAIGAFIIDVVRDWVEDDLNRIINTWIDQDAPDWVRDFFVIGSDLISVVTNMEVISKIRLSKPRRDGTFDGSQNWLGLAFYWRLPCQGDPDPECGRYAFTMDEVSSAAEGIQLVFGQFSGRIHSYNVGIIDSHTMDLQYGRLILFVLNNIILPWLADGATNMRDALLNLANCPSFANGITGGRSHLRLAGINIVSRNTIEGWCTSIMGVVGSAAEAIIGRLRIDTRLTLQGDLIFVEETDDLVVDRMEEGVWRGVIRTSEDEGPPFVGDFVGTKEQPADAPE